jgi:Trk K+ transport system NAD-binding subunit
VVLSEEHRLEGVPLARLKIPKGVLVALVGRDRNVFVPDGATCLKSGDHVILFASTAQMSLAAEFFG